MTRRPRTDLKSLFLVIVVALALLVLAASAEESSSPSQSSTESQAPEEELQEFVPSERVAADKGVAFPVDI